MNGKQVARELMKVAKELVAGHNEKGLVRALEAMGFADWEYQNRTGLKGVALSQRLYKGLIDKNRRLFPKVAEKYGYVYMPNIAYAFFVPKDQLEKAKRKTYVHRDIEILAPRGDIDPTYPYESWEVPEIRSEFLSLEKAKKAIDELYDQYVQDTEYFEDDFGDFHEWLAEFNG